MTPAWARSLAYLTGQGIEALVLIVGQRLKGDTPHPTARCGECGYLFRQHSEMCGSATTPRTTKASESTEALGPLPTTTVGAIPPYGTTNSNR